VSQLLDIYVARQPIFKRDLTVFGYELLFRANNQENQAVILGGDEASAQVMMGAFGDMGISDVVGEDKAFVNFTEGLLLRENQPFFPRRQVVIEILEDVKVTPKLIQAVRQLKEKGYTIALDDYVFNPDFVPLEAFADILKIDILSVGPKKLIEHATRLKNHDLKLLAEKVETREQFEFCVKLGFDYFQGYFFSKPKIVAGKRLPNNKLLLLELLSNVYDPDVDMHKLSEIIGRDVGLSQKLLRFVAEGYPKYQPMSSIHDAVLRFGLDRLKSWTSMLVLSGVDDKPLELFQTSLIRAKCCELIGQKVGHHSKDSYFTVGLFSTLDAVMAAPFEGLLEKLKLESHVEQALLNYDGLMGETLELVVGLERGRTDMKVPPSISIGEASHCYLQAMQFAKSVNLA